MKLTRISNAGLWVETDGVYFLLDGLHGGDVHPYCGMDPAWEQKWGGTAPEADVLAFTHAHPDHFEPGRVCRYLAAHPKTKVYAGPDVLSVLRAQGVAPDRLLSWQAPGPLGLSAFPTRHIGPEFRDVFHCSLVLQGDSILLFAGDASPVRSNFLTLPPSFSPDILAAPFPFVLGNAPFRIIQSILRPQAVCILHLPAPQEDPACFWLRARRGAASLPMPTRLMKLGETMVF
ncbi:MAG: MBL fold metallo-hydrolase [Clostridia bacterium]|nr:MBL fold metallo-hydrolase [Clostridia bacterium]